MDTKRSQSEEREIEPATLDAALERIAQRRILARGEVDFPCVPALLDAYVKQLLDMWEALGKPFSGEERTNLRNAVEMALAAGFEATPYARMVVSYEASAPPVGVRYAIRLKENTIEQHYAHWLSERTPPLFGTLPDAKVVALAATLGDCTKAPVLDLGAGTGRNAIPLARLGHPVDAVELVPALADEMKKARSAERLPIEIIVADLLSSEFSIRRNRYKLAVLSEVASHFRDVEDLRSVFVRFADALVPGGLAVVNVFVAVNGYEPNTLAKQVSEVSWSRIFTRAELAFVTEELPFDGVSDESVYDHELGHSRPEAWPPTSWFVDWSQGRNVFDLPLGRAPIELRWLVYRRR